MKRCAIAAIAAAAMIAAPAVAVTTTMLANFPVESYPDSVSPQVSIRSLGYQCDYNGLSGFDTTYIATSGVDGSCTVNPTGYYLQDTDNNNKLMASVQFNNVLRRDPSTGKDVVVVGAVAFGSDDGKTTCCSVAGVTVAPVADPTINATCKPCQLMPSQQLQTPADVVFNAGAGKTVHVDFFDSISLTAQRCDYEDISPQDNYQASDSCVGPTKRFALSSPATPATCNVTLVAPIDIARAVSIATGVTRGGLICADVAVAAVGTSNVVKVAKTCGSCKNAGF